jgi:hypothetical protein
VAPPEEGALMDYPASLDRLREAYRLAMAAAEQLEGIAVPPKERAHLDWAILGLQAAANRCQGIGQAITRERNGERREKG